MKNTVFVGKISSNNSFSNITFAKSTKKEPKRNIVKGVGSLAGVGYIGQQTIRSGIPRLLGVRLESHSTSKKNAKEILKNGGILDPNKSGTGAIQTLNVSEGKKGVTNAAEAGKKVYITGVHSDANSRKISGLGTVDPKKENPLLQVLNRKEQRAGYRGQADIDWNSVNKDSDKIKQLENEVSQSSTNKKKTFNRDTNKTRLDNIAKQKEIKALKEGTTQRLLKEKVSRVNGLMLNHLLGVS